MKIKFPTKDEDAYMLQFAKKLLMIGTNTKDLMMEVEVDYELGEIIHFSYENAFCWNKGEKSIVMKPTPINFNDS